MKDTFSLGDVGGLVQLLDRHRNGAVHVFLTAFTKIAPAIDASTPTNLQPDAEFEQSFAEEGFTSELEEWPEY